MTTVIPVFVRTANVTFVNGIKYIANGVIPVMTYNKDSHTEECVRLENRKNSANAGKQSTNYSNEVQLDGGLTAETVMYGTYCLCPSLTMINVLVLINIYCYRVYRTSNSYTSHLELNHNSFLNVDLI